MADGRRFSGEVLDREQHPIVSANGDLDLATVPQLLFLVDSVFVRTPGDLVLDFTHVTFFSASGLGALVGMKNRLPCTSRLVLRNLSPMVLEVLAITEMEATFTIMQKR
jgi:anti-anti-sigma factor